jgi:hypothetical protein
MSLLENTMTTWGMLSASQIASLKIDRAKREHEY